jgi:hypothetical protein
MLAGTGDAHQDLADADRDHLPGDDAMAPLVD